MWPLTLRLNHLVRSSLVPRVTGLLFGREGRSRPSSCAFFFMTERESWHARTAVVRYYLSQRANVHHRRRKKKKHVRVGRRRFFHAILCPPMRLFLAPPSVTKDPRAFVGPREISLGGRASGLVTSPFRPRVFLLRCPGPGSSAGFYLCAVRATTLPRRCPCCGSPVPR